MGSISYIDSQGSKAAINGKHFEEISGLNFNKLHLKYNAYPLGCKIDDGYYISENGKPVCISYPKKKFKLYLNSLGIFPKKTTYAKY